MNGIHLVVLGLMGFVHHLVFIKTCGKLIHFWPLVKGYEGTYLVRSNTSFLSHRTTLSKLITSCLYI